MDDLISRQDAIDAMANTLWHYPNECYKNLNEYEFAKGLAELGLKSVPSVQPEPKTGHWIYVGDGYADYCKCSECGDLSDYEENFCSNCGADMRGNKDG